MTTFNIKIHKRVFYYSTVMYSPHVAFVQYDPADSRFAAGISRSYEINIGTLDPANRLFPTVEDGIAYHEATAISEIISELNTNYAGFGFDFVFDELLEQDIQILSDTFDAQAALISSLQSTVSNLTSRIETLENPAP